ncbi:MAG: SPOR domain-containing protein [Burkholderiales bacterium]
MRALFLLLLLANLGFYVYMTYLRGSPGDDAQIALLQISPEKMRIAKPGAPPPARGEPKSEPAPALPQACIEWGPFDASDRKFAEPQLAALALGDRLSVRDVGDGSFWVYIPPLKTKPEADRKSAEVRARGVTDFSILPGEGPWQWAISFGVYRNEDNAKSRLAQLREKGIRSAVLGPRGGDTLFVVRDPSDAVTAKLAVLQKDFPLTELKPVTCIAPGKP